MGISEIFRSRKFFKEPHVARNQKNFSASKIIFIEFYSKHNKVSPIFQRSNNN